MSDPRLSAAMLAVNAATAEVVEKWPLDAAWTAVEAVLPQGWYISNVRRRSPNSRYSASATLGYSDTGESMSGFGPTAPAALLALAKRLSEPPFTPSSPAPTPAPETD